MHDTHVHVDLLMQKLGHTDQRNANVSKESHDIIDQLFEDHRFAIQATVDTENFLLMQNILQNHPKFFSLMGSHPEIVKKEFDVSSYVAKQRSIIDQSLEQLSTLKINAHGEDKSIWSHSFTNISRVFPRLSTHRCIGLGEIGLDYYYSQEDSIISKQKLLLEHQLELATESELPVVFHCRDAFDDLFDILDNHSVLHGKFLVHCFTGTIENLKSIIERGGIAGFGGISTFKNAEYLRDAFEYCPLDSYVLETDLPFLAPIPFRGKVCLPSYIEQTATTLASIKSL